MAKESAALGPCLGHVQGHYPALPRNLSKTLRRVLPGLATAFHTSAQRQSLHLRWMPGSLPPPEGRKHKLRCFAASSDDESSEGFSFAVKVPKSESPELPVSIPAVTVWGSYRDVREKKPLIQCITNFVSMEPVANTLLAAGASPAMVHALPEVEEFASLASALYINIGTLSPEWVESMMKAAERVNSIGTPWVLDPVGAGATKYRTDVSRELLKLKPTVVRGNPSEIAALAGAAGVVTRGVDSTLSSSSALEAARSLAAYTGCVVAVTGATDFITDGPHVYACANGVPMLQAVTATGCSVSALIAAFIAVQADWKTPENEIEAKLLKLAALHGTGDALAIFGIAAEVAVKKKRGCGPGSLRPALLDALHGLKEEQVLSGCRLSLEERGTFHYAVSVGNQDG